MNCPVLFFIFLGLLQNKGYVMNKEPTSARAHNQSMLKLIQKLLLIPGEIVSSQVVMASTRRKKDNVEKAMKIMEGARLGKKNFCTCSK